MHADACAARSVREKVARPKARNDSLQREQLAPWFAEVRKLAPIPAACLQCLLLLQEPRIGHNRALAAAGLPHIALHGLRRSFGTLAEWVDAPVGIVAQIQGHKPGAIAEKHYRVRPLDLLRLWHERIEAWMLAEAGIERPNKHAVSLRAVADVERQR